MPNGWDRNWVRFTLTVAAFHAELGVWPTTIRLSPDMLAHLRGLFSSERLAILERRISLVPDEDMDIDAFFCAEDDAGRSCYYGAPVETDETAQARQWLGVRPDNPHGWKD